MRRLSAPLFHATDIARSELQLAVLGLVEPPAIDTIEFPSEAGGDQERQLALPFLAGMDEIVVREAELAFRVGDFKIDATFAAVAAPGGGARLSLTRPGRLREAVVRYGPAPSDTRFVVRPVEAGRPGPPILADPPCPAPGPMFGPVLAGLSATALGNSRHLLRFPDLTGAAWDLAIATGGTPDELAPTAMTIAVERVAVAAEPRNLSLTLLGEPPTPLWENADVLTRDSGEQSVGFLPIAQRRLSEALDAANAAAAGQPPPLTLPLTLRFHSDTAARLEVTRRRLSAEYRVRPLGGAPVTLSLSGRPATLAFSAPPALRPSRGHVTLTARLSGRALNGSSAAAGTQPAAAGLRATADRWIAARAPVAGAGAAVRVASVSLYVETPEAAELVLELRGDVAGRPGPMLAPPVVRRCEAGFVGWADFLLGDTLGVTPGKALWPTLRLTKGSARWHARAEGPTADGLGVPAVSVDQGASWADTSQPLGRTTELLVQVFDALPPPFPRPRIRFHEGAAAGPADWFATATAEGTTQYRAVELSLPPSILDRVAATPPVAGNSRVETEIALHSDTVMDLILEDAVFGYEPLAS